MSSDPLSDRNVPPEEIGAQGAERCNSLVSSHQDAAPALAALRMGDERAFLELFNSLHSTLVAIARGYVWSDDHAEEVAQETWVAVVRGLGRYRAECALKTWIVSILIKRAKTCAVGVQRGQLLGGRLHGSDWVSGGERSPSPEDDCLARENRDRVWGAIGMLPERLRLVLTLRDIQGMTAAQTSELLGVSEGNQRVLLHRARKKLGALLQAASGKRS